MGAARRLQRRLAVVAVRGDAVADGARHGSAAAPRGDALTLLAAFGAVWFIWGSTYLAIAWAVETIPPLPMIGARCLVAGGALYGWSRLRGGARPRASDWGAALAAGTLLFVTGQALLAWSETRIASGVAALLVATEPLFIVLLSWLGFGVAAGAGAAAGAGKAGARGGAGKMRTRGPGPRTLIALAAGFGGVALVVLPGGVGTVDVAGAAAALGASLSWSVGVMVAGARPGLRPAQVAGMQLLAGGAVLAVLTPLGGDPFVMPSLRSLLAFGYLVVFGSVITFAAYIWLLGRVGPARLSTHAYVNPLVAVALGALLAGETVTIWLMGAGALILGSVVVLVRGERGPAPSARAGAGERPAPPLTGEAAA